MNFNVYIFLKYVHILAAIIMVGTTFVNGLLRVYINKSGVVNKIALGSELIMVLNRFLMGPSLLLLPVSGALLVWKTGYTFQMDWIFYSMILLGAIIGAFLLGYNVESALEKISAADFRAGEKDISENYKRKDLQAIPIGVTATILIFIVLYLMIAKG